MLHAARSFDEVVSSGLVGRVRRHRLDVRAVLGSAAVKRRLVGGDGETSAGRVAHRQGLDEHHIGSTAVAAAVTGLPVGRTGLVHVHYQSRGPVLVTSSLRATWTSMASPNP